MTPRTFQQRNARVGLRPGRAGQRGGAVFIVLLVLTMISAVGVFAVRASGLNQRTSGYDRQSTQTNYVADYATLAVIDEVSGPKSQTYYDMVRAGTEPCEANQYVVAGGQPIPCYKLYAEEIQSRFVQAGSNAQLYDPAGGSLGPASPKPLEADFRVEMTDPGPAAPVAGADLGGSGVTGKYVQLTISGTGQVRPRVASAACADPTDQDTVKSLGSKTTRATIRMPYWQ